jgi:4-hydroxy-tetrahydrodipicolinate reductase
MTTLAPPVRIALFGATGRMGRCLIRAIHESPEFELTAAGVSPDSPTVGADAGTSAGLAASLGIPLAAVDPDGVARAQVAIDFSVAAAVEAHLATAVAAGVGLVIGTTALSAETLRAVDAASHVIPVLVAANTSIGVNLLAQLIEHAAASLPREYDIEIFEAHHRYKVDAPSGTALQLGAAACSISWCGSSVARRGSARGPRRGVDRFLGAARRGHRGRAHGVFRRSRRTDRDDASGPRSHDVRLRGVTGGRLAGAAGARALHHEGRTRVRVRRAAPAAGRDSRLVRRQALP